MYNKKVRKGILIGVTISAIILISFLGTYAYFINININKTPEELSINTGNMELTFSDGTSSFQGALDFGNSAIKSFTIENTGSLEAKGRIKWKNLVNTYLKGSLNYTLSYSETEDGEYTPIIENRNVPVSETEITKTLAPELVIPAGITYYYKLEITLNYLENVDQTSDLNAMLTTEFILEEAIGEDVDFLDPSEKTLSILNIKTKEGSPNFANAATTDETSDGLYSLEDDYGTSYYYRGAVTNNYVKFAGYYWRIIRVNGDGSLRIIYDGTKAYTNGTSDSGRLALSSKWSGDFADAKFVGYMYGSKGSTKRIYLGEEGYEDSTNAIFNQTPANIKTQLETWYKTNIFDKTDSSGNSYDDYVSDEIFCNDRSIPGKEVTNWTPDTGLGYSNKATGYGSLSRFLTGNNSATLSARSDPKPQFKCSNKNDAFTKEDTEKGNGKLGQKVGLITADEVSAAGGTAGTNNLSYYLYKGSRYWTLSPYFYYTNGKASLFTLDTNGVLSGYGVSNLFGIVPVINLSPEYVAKMVGDGTIGQEYHA